MKATHIVVIQSGWVFVGTKDASSPQGQLTFHNAACIRRWGTTKGIGELALSGPTGETVLDECGTLEVPMSAVHFTIPVDKSKWV